MPDASKRCKHGIIINAALGDKDPCAHCERDALREENAALRRRVGELENFVREELRVSERVQAVRERQGSTKPLERKTLAVGAGRIEKMRALLSPPRAEGAKP